MSQDGRLHVALLGGSPDMERWAAALGSIAAVRPLPEELPGTINALVLASGAGDPFGRAKEALLAGVPVLYAGPFQLSPWQASALSELSKRRQCLLRFAEPYQFRPGFSFLRRLLQGDEPFWRPLYLRALHLAQPDEVIRIDELATDQLAVCETLLGGVPTSVTAAASRRGDLGEVCAVFLTLNYADGPVAQCTVSLTEGASSHQLVVAAPGRTVILDDLDPVPTIRIVGAGEQCAERTSSSRLPPKTGCAPDPVTEEARAFLAAVADGDLSSANGDRWTRVASLWWAARQSMSFGGAAEVPSPTVHPADAEPPPFKVIQGGGSLPPAASRRPRLTVVGS